MDIAGNALTKRTVKSAILDNFEHSSRVHGVALLRSMGLLLLYLSSALWLLGLGTNNVILNTAILILGTATIGLITILVNCALLSCKCGQVSLRERNKSDTQARSIRSRRRIKQTRLWFLSLLAGPFLLIVALMCIALQHRELIPSATSIIRLVALYAATFATMLGLVLLLISNSKLCQRAMRNSRFLTDANFSVQLLDGKSHDELNELVSCAIAQGNLELAEIISQRLLLSVETL